MVLRRAVEAGGGQAFFGICVPLSSKRTPRLVEALPGDSLLAESDAEGPDGFQDRVEAATRLIADVRGWSLGVAEEQLAGNARAFLDGA